MVNTHLHFDHAGNNDLLTKATFFVQREHYAAAQANNASFPHQYWNLPHLRYELLDGESALFSGLEILLTPGTPRRPVGAARLPETGPGDHLRGRGLLRGELRPRQLGRPGGPGTARKSALKLRETAKREGAQLFYGHDRNQARDIRYAPHSYR